METKKITVKVDNKDVVIEFTKPLEEISPDEFLCDTQCPYGCEKCSEYVSGNFKFFEFCCSDRKSVV